MRLSIQLTILLGIGTMTVGLLLSRPLGYGIGTVINAWGGVEYDTPFTYYPWWQNLGASVIMTGVLAVAGFLVGRSKHEAA